MFFANYFFHKFGCEICFVSTVITVWIRQDFWGSFYAVFLLILMIISFQSRTHLKRVWKTYTMMLSIIWAIQVRFNRFHWPFYWLTNQKRPLLKLIKVHFYSWSPSGVVSRLQLESDPSKDYSFS